MAPAAPPKGKGKPGLLKAKLGPVPVWIIGAAVLALVVFVVMRKRAGGSSGDVGDAVLSGGQIGPQAAASGGQPSQNAAPADSLSPEVLDTLNELATSVNGISSDLAYYSATKAAASEAPDVFQAAASGMATAGSVVLEKAAPAQTAAQKQTNAPQPAQGVLWGGQTFTTKSALTKWLNARGVTWATWAGNHPDAAKKLR